MVKSLLDKTITYNESRNIDDFDEDYSANLYETIVFEKNIVFALGLANYLYADNNIIYYPIYLVENDEIKTQIGVYEIIATNQKNIMDEDGDIDLNKFSKPLLYSFAYEEIYSSYVSDDVIEMPIKNSKHKLWIQKFMNDSDYNIIDMKPDGNCFFSMIKMALEENGQETTIDEMRDILAQNATDNLFENYKLLYDDGSKAEENLSREIKNITKRHNDLETTMKKTKDRNLSLSYIKQSETMKQLHNNLKSQRKNIRENIKDFDFMKGIDNLSMLKLKMKTNEFWADTWAISTIERELNIKTIIFSELYFKEKDSINVLQCGQLNDTKLEENGIFEPSMYILSSHHGGNHYQLITYKTEKSFKYSELPENIKILIVEKCLEKMAGPYSLIPDFVNYRIKLNSRGDEEDKILKLDNPDAMEGTNAEGTNAEGTNAEGTTTEETTSDLYDNATIFRFYSKSIDKPLPGKGSGEIIGQEGTDAYKELAKIPEWRKKLSNFWISDFVLDKHRWASVEHYYQGSKYKHNNKQFYIQFSLDSPDSDIAKDPSLAKAAGGKSGMTTKLVDGVKKKVMVRPKNVIMDPDFFNKSQGMKYSRGEMEMESSMRAKFTQNPELKELLLATKRAKLEHITRGKPAIVFNDLMRVRLELKNEA